MWCCSDVCKRGRTREQHLPSVSFLKDTDEQFRMFQGKHEKGKTELLSACGKQSSVGIILQALEDDGAI